MGWVQGRLLKSSARLQVCIASHILVYRSGLRASGFRSAKDYNFGMRRDGSCCRRLINKPPPLNSDYSRDPNIKALYRRGFINYESTLPWPGGHLNCLARVPRLNGAANVGGFATVRRGL